MLEYRNKHYNHSTLLQVHLILSMPRVPLDLRCLDNCTDVDFPTNDVDCSNFPFGSFLGCYLSYKAQQFDNVSYGLFVSSTYFDLAVEACVLAILEPTFYPEGNCDQLGVNLRIFNQMLPSSAYLSNSLPGIATTRLQGPGTEDVVDFGGQLGLDVPLKNRHPWLCSLRTPGYRGVHRCGVTLLSGPPQPTIFVSAAHCNYICKDDRGRVVDICCCRDSPSLFSCRASNFCGANSNLQLALPQDLQIVCNLRTQEAVPQGLAYPSNITILDIIEIRNHPGYLPLTKGSPLGGPSGGYDISVYIVNASSFTMDTSSIWPACLPRAKDAAYLPGNQGILVGWIEPVPTYYLDVSVRKYARDYLIAREALFEGLPVCADPGWMRSTTYYPPGTLCYTSAGWAGSVQFGVSGSGLVRPFTFADGNGTTDSTRYSWVGPLSLSKGSDRTIQTSYVDKVDYSSNPAVFTDGRCYLDWIAAQYGLSLPPGYTRPASCDTAAGDKMAANNTNCLSRTFSLVDAIQSNKTVHKCQFSAEGLDRCKLFAYIDRAKPNVNSNFYYCINTEGQKAICANDCPGVDPNAVVVGGEAALLSLAIATSVGPNLLGPVLGAGVGLAGLGLGGVAMNSRQAACRARQCRTQEGKCCNTLRINGRRLCPMNC